MAPIHREVSTMFDTLDDVIKRARELADEGLRLSALEENEGAVPGYAWQALDDARAEFVYTLARMEVLD